MSLTNVRTAVQNLYSANTEKGNNKAKRAFLEAAKTALAAAIADSGNGTTLTTAGAAAAKAAVTQIIYAENQEDNLMNGSTGLALNELRGAEYLHVENALASAQAALAAGCNAPV